MANYKRCYSSKVINFNDHKMKRLIDKNHSIREFGDRYEYCFIKEYENKYEDFTCDSIEFEDCFVQILTVKGEHKLVSIDFPKSLFTMEYVIGYLDIYWFKLLRIGENEIKEACELMEAKKFRGTPIVFYEKGAYEIPINREELVEVTEEFTNNSYNINTHNSKTRNSIEALSKIFLNDQEIDFIPEIETDPSDLIISNGHIIVARYIGDYLGGIAFYKEKDDPLPISWIYDKNTNVYINVHHSENKKIITLDHSYAIDIEDFN